MFIEIIVDGVPGVARGTIIDVPDGVGTAYIAANQAKQSDAMSAMRASVTQMLAERDAELKRSLEELKTASRGTGNAPGGDPGVEFRRIEAGESSVERGPRGTTDVLRSIALATIGEGEARTRAAQRLTSVYKAERVAWDGTSVQRDGTESLSGGPTYGYFVRPEYIQDVFMIMAEESVMTGARSIPIGNALETNYPALDQFGTTSGTKNSNYFAGITLYRAGETTARTASDASLNNIPFKITDLTGLTKVSRDLVADSFVSMDAFLNKLFGMAFTHRKDYDYIRGSGVGEPLGWFNAPSLIGGGGVSGNAGRTTANQILYADLAWMLSKLHPNCWRSAMWVAHTSTLPWLMGIQSTSGTFVYQPNSLISQADRPSIYGPGRFQGTMLGLPVRFTEKVSALGTAGDLNLISVDQYGECMRSGLEIGMTMDRYWELDEIGFKWKLRNDGKPLWRKSFTDMTGSTSSWAIQLV